MNSTLQQMLYCLNARDYANLAHFYDFPFMMETEQTSVVFFVPGDAMAAWARFHAEMAQLGVVRSDARLIAVELPRMSRQRVWLEFQHFDAAGNVLRSADLTMYFRLRGSKLTLLMQHITRQSIPARWAVASR